MNWPELERLKDAGAPPGVAPSEGITVKPAVFLAEVSDDLIPFAKS
jgi:hypothetical protein